MNNLLPNFELRPATELDTSVHYGSASMCPHVCIPTFDPDRAFKCEGLFALQLMRILSVLRNKGTLQSEITFELCGRGPRGVLA